MWPSTPGGRRRKELASFTKLTGSHVVQEVTLAASALICYGKYEVDWMVSEAAISLLREALNMVRGPYQMQKHLIALGISLRPRAITASCLVFEFNLALFMLI